MYSPETITFVAVICYSLAELIHAWRVSKISVLAFGDKRRPAGWAMASPFLRIAAFCALSWGIITLYFLDPKIHKGNEIPDAQKKHLVIILDVSPSMGLDDAGPQKDQARRKRAAEVMESFFKRVVVDEYKVSVVAVYNGAKSVVVDSKDLEVVRHIMEEIPMYFAFKPGKTKLYSGLEEAARIAKDWNPKSTTLLMITDGDTVPATGVPRMPASIKNLLIVGIGDSQGGKFIDGHQSRQDSSTLRSIAVRMNGFYHDGNKNHISSSTISDLTSSDINNSFDELGKREYALIAIAIGATVLALLPLFLFYFGTFWRPGVKKSVQNERQITTFQRDT